uniref:Protein kinase domain-containing protein n=1 Tax=Lactuca sativa TaxID=4236 RepID=A0A9R1VP86_LACSA|nr:hypothetical protein LSAT_V11C400209090 [Lactuca sativa]
MGDNNSLMTGRVLLAFDATKDRNELEFKNVIDDIISRGDVINRGDTIVVFGVLHKVSHPFGYQMQIERVNIRAMEEEIQLKLDMYAKMLQTSAEDCKEEGVDIEVKITCGTPIKKIIQQEASACNATWVVLDRHLKKDVKFYQGQILCKLASVVDNLTIKPLKTEPMSDTDNTEVKVVLYRSKHVQLSAPAPQDHDNVDQSLISASLASYENLEMPSKKLLSSLMHKPSILTDDVDAASKQDVSGQEVYITLFSTYNGPRMLALAARKTRIYNRCLRFKLDIIHASLLWGYVPCSLSCVGKNRTNSSSVVGNLRKSPRRKRSSGTPVLCNACGMTTELYIKESMRFSYSEIHLATNYFSEENLLGEGGYGLVYKGQLNDGQIIAAKVRKQASTQGFEEFSSEIYVLSFARHRNIVMLLGYCCKENINILVYEYICNRSLEWHLFDEAANVLEWRKRHAIAIGTAKGLRFLHEECRSSPIIHRDLRPSNILLTHDFVPMVITAPKLSLAALCVTYPFYICIPVSHKTYKSCHITLDGTNFMNITSKSDSTRSKLDIQLNPSCGTWDLCFHSRPKDEFVVLQLGDFGLAKWKTNDSPIQTRILGTLGYVAPEYAENGMVSVRTDVYAYGITLIQIISGRKAVTSDTQDHHQSLRQWAEPLVESLALHDLIDPRLGDSYDPYELYHMAKTAYLCVKVDPDKRPSMGEVSYLTTT